MVMAVSILDDSDIAARGRVYVRLGRLLTGPASMHGFRVGAVRPEMATTSTTATAEVATHYQVRFLAC